MDCPACGKNLVEMQAGDKVVDACDGGCGGIWFDRFELQAVDEKREVTGAPLLQVKRDPHHTLRPGRRHCPRCEKRYPLIQRMFHPTVRIQIDECPGCGGHWLDQGELADIRERSKTQKEREHAASQIYAGLVAPYKVDMPTDDKPGLFWQLLMRVF